MTDRDLSQPVSHPALAAAAARLRAEPGDPAWNAMLAELTWGELLLDMSGSDVRWQSPGVMAPGSTISIRSVVDEQGASGVVAFTSQEEVHRTHPSEDPSGVATLVQGSLDVLETVGSTYAFLALDPAGANVRVYADAAAAVRRGTLAPAVKTALALPDGPARTEAVIAALAAADGIAHAAIPGTENDPEGVAVVTTTSPDGRPMAMLFTSTFEVEVRAPGQGAYSVPVRGALETAIDRYAGAVIDPGTRWIELSREELQRAIDRMPPA